MASGLAGVTSVADLPGAAVLAERLVLSGQLLVVLATALVPEQSAKQGLAWQQGWC